MEKQNVFGGPWALPIVRFGPTPYFADLRLRQFREVSNPHNYVEFDSEQGRQMCEQTGVVVCLECGLSAVIPTTMDRKELRCMRCLALIVGPLEG